MIKQIPGFRVFRNAEGGGDGSSGGDGEGSTKTSDGTAGAAADASRSSSSASASVPSGVGSKPDSPPATGDFKESLGELKDDAALQHFKDAASLAKAFKDTKALVGQKLGIPDENSTPEAKAAFEKAMGVPDNEDGYELDKLPDDVPEELKNAFDPEHAKKWAKTFKELGVPLKTAKALQKAQMDEIGELHKEFKGSTEQKDEDFNKVADKTFGEQKDKVLQSAATDIEKYVSLELREMADKQLPGVMLAMVAQLSQGIRKELGGEDTAYEGEGGSGKTVAELREEARSIMKSPEWGSPFTEKGKEGHEEAKRKASEIFQQIDRMEQAERRKKR